MKSDECHKDKTSGKPHYLKQVKVVAGNGGTFISGSWVTRSINREDIDTANVASLNANEIILVF